MTEPTIKEKINNFFSEPGIGYYDIEMSKKDLYNYTRLICEEMTGGKKGAGWCNEIDNPSMHKNGCPCAMYNLRIKEEEQKAQKILILTKIQNAILKDFARLICEEMTGKMIIPAETFGDQGYNVRVAENEVKAQEILKALE